MPFGLGGMGGLLGGTQLGNAHGRITIDTSQARAAEGEMRGIGDRIRRAMENAGRGAQKFAADIKSIRKELVAVGAVAAGISFFGFKFTVIGYRFVAHDHSFCCYAAGTLSSANTVSENLFAGIHI